MWIEFDEEDRYAMKGFLYFQSYLKFMYATVNGFEYYEKKEGITGSDRHSWRYFPLTHKHIKSKYPEVFL